MIFVPKDVAVRIIAKRARRLSIGANQTALSDFRRIKTINGWMGHHILEKGVYVHKTDLDMGLAKSMPQLHEGCLKRYRELLKLLGGGCCREGS
jgi:hypothetical protein